MPTFKYGGHGKLVSDAIASEDVIEKFKDRAVTLRNIRRYHENEWS